MTEFVTLVEKPRFPYPSDKTWTSADRPNPNVVHVAAVTEDGLMVIVKQWRPPVQAYVWELPAGLMDVQGETIEECAARELLEETGYSSDFEPVILMDSTVSAGLTNEISHLVQIRLEIYGEPVASPEEGIEVMLIDTGDDPSFIYQMLRKTGHLVDSKIFSALSFVKE